ncbi:MAG: prepilin-type N-terminal cleavage/methylation domain-containing protein [Planctomycetota bacterium]|nr:prepilin-type N-terminal cleavage/methylation domain-containing protein [Planctomycetota bacterium]
MMQRGGRHAFTLFELLLALALLAALSSLVIGVLLRSDRAHDLLQVQLEALVDVSCMHAQRERTALMVWGQSDVVFAQLVGVSDEQTPPVYLRALPGQLSWEEPAPLALIAPDGTVLPRIAGRLADGHLVELGAVSGQVTVVALETLP